MNYCIYLCSKVLGTGFDRVPGGEEEKSKSILAFHYYCWWYDYPKLRKLVKQTCDHAFAPQVSSSRLLLLSIIFTF